ncbi:hypothetical protein Dimus_027687 [Dionaea muscipula]
MVKQLPLTTSSRPPSPLHYPKNPQLLQPPPPLPLQELFLTFVYFEAFHVLQFSSHSSFFFLCLLQFLSVSTTQLGKESVCRCVSVCRCKMTKSGNVASMAFFSKQAFLLLVSLIVVAYMVTTVAVATKEFEVGDREGWHVPDANDTSFYNDWAESKRFHIGDSLRFQYNNDSVLVVDKYGYYHCIIDNAIASYTGDNTTVITLFEPGLIYFISGDAEHCKNGQRLIVDVMSPRDHSLFAGPPESDLAMSPKPSPNSGAVVTMTVILALVAFITAFAILLWCAP